MATKTKPKPLSPEAQAEVFAQLLDHLGTMPKFLAGKILKIKPDEKDHDRLRDLLVRNQENDLDPHEIEEMDDRIRSGTWLAILHSLARTTRKHAKSGAVVRA